MHLCSAQPLLPSSPFKECEEYVLPCSAQPLLPIHSSSAHEAHQERSCGSLLPISPCKTSRSFILALILMEMSCWLCSVMLGVCSQEGTEQITLLISSTG